jgi:hypothetical protein
MDQLTNSFMEKIQIDVMNSKYLDRFSFLEQNFTRLITNYNKVKKLWIGVGCRDC